MNFESFSISVVDRQMPAWKDQVERWYQLDAASFAVCQALHEFKQKHELDFEILILASCGGSNLADLDFVKTGCQSPAKFVYTLPNIAISVLCQMLSWQGQTHCVTYRKNEPSVVIREAEETLQWSQKNLLLILLDPELSGASVQVQIRLIRCS